MPDADVRIDEEQVRQLAKVFVVALFLVDYFRLAFDAAPTFFAVTRGALFAVAVVLDTINRLSCVNLSYVDVLDVIWLLDVVENTPWRSPNFFRQMLVFSVHLPGYQSVVHSTAIHHQCYQRMKKFDSRATKQPLGTMGWPVGQCALVFPHSSIGLFDDYLAVVTEVASVDCTRGSNYPKLKSKRRF